MRLPGLRYPLALALSSLAGCYGYYATPNAGGVVGRRVQLSLSDSGSVMLASQLGPSSNAVEGRLVADSANLFLVSVVGVQRRDGNGSEWKGENVSIPQPFVTGVAERRFSWGRTAITTVLTGAALVAAQQAFSGRGFGGGGGTSSRPGTK
jgi:hypothetical protein